MESERMLQWFDCSELPDDQKATASQFDVLATNLVHQLIRGPERTVALRKLLEARTAALRATLIPGG